MHKILFPKGGDEAYQRGGTYKKNSTFKRWGDFLEWGPTRTLQ